MLKRVDEVFDCWFESGAMPYAQQHYPYENKDKFEKSFRFTVSDGPLSQFDDAPPACGANEICANRAACYTSGPLR